MDEEDHLSQMIKVINSNPYASGLNHLKSVPGSKSEMELEAGRNWMVAMNKRFGTQITNVKEGGDPPDIACNIDGAPHSIEVVALVKSDVRAQMRPSSESCALWEDMQYSRESFLGALTKVIESKVRKYSNPARDLKFDTLLIQAYDNWLLPEDINNWLPSYEVPDQSVFDSIYIIQEYVPQHPDRYPLHVVLHKQNVVD